MLKTRLYTFGAGLLAAATFALTGCGDAAQTDGTDSQPTTSAPQVSAHEAFGDALKKLGEQSFRTNMKMEGLVTLTSTGAVDPAAKKAGITMQLNAGGMQMTVEIRALDSDVWAKMAGVPGLPEGWLHVPASQIKAGSALDTTRSPAEMAQAVVSVERDGATAFKGTLDLTKAGTINQETVKQLGDKATAVPFTATVDDQGRLVTMTIDMNAIQPGIGKMTTTYSGYGDPVNVTAPPAAEVTEMPAQILELLSQS